MQQVNFGQHRYVDLSDLNARWDQDFPGGYRPGASPVHGLGNGSLSGNALGIVANGVGQDPTYPWMQESPDTRQLQEDINDKLDSVGCEPIAEDSTLGPKTCAAAQIFDMDPPSCQSFGTPPVCDGGIDPSDAEASMLPSGGEPNWLAIGAAVGLVALGGAVLYTKRQGK